MTITPEQLDLLRNVSSNSDLDRIDEALALIPVLLDERDEIAALKESASQKPFMYAICDKFGTAFLDEACVASKPEQLSESVQDSAGSLFIVPVYTGPCIEKMRDEIANLDGEVEALRRTVHDMSKSLIVTPKDAGKYWKAQCPECHWVGPSKYCGGGGPIADTGDYSDITCPVCGHDVDDADDDELKPNAVGIADHDRANSEIDRLRSIIARAHAALLEMFPGGLKAKCGPGGNARIALEALEEAKEGAEVKP